MRNKKFKLIVLLLLGLGLTGLQAQKAVMATGGDGSGSGGSISYSVGQAAYVTMTGTNGTMAPGVQHPYEIYVGLDEDKGITLSCAVYPNPSSDLLTLKVKNLNHSALSYCLYDMNGNTLENIKLTGDEARIDMSGFAPAIYFLKVSDNIKEVKTFKIIKN